MDEWANIYYLFLDVHQWGALKELVEAYFRDEKVGSGFMQQARDKVLEARHFQDMNREWFRWEEWEKKTGLIKESPILEPYWSFRWALHDLKALEDKVRGLMAKYLGMQIKHERARERLEQLETARKILNFEWPLGWDVIK